MYNVCDLVHEINLVQRKEHTLHIFFHSINLFLFFFDREVEEEQ